MSTASRPARITVVLFSLTLLVAYVWHSQVTPNTPPPDPLGLNTVELELQPEGVEFEGFINYGTPVAVKEVDDAASSVPVFRPPWEIRIISSKVVNQPIFSFREVPFRWAQPAQKLKPEFGFGQFGIHIDGKLAPGHASPSNNRTETPNRAPTSFWQRFFGKRHVKHDRQASQPASVRSGSDLRIISSKVINQPVFTVHKFIWSSIPEPEAKARDPFVPLPRPFLPPIKERVGTRLLGFEMTGLSIDPLRKPDKP